MSSPRLEMMFACCERHDCTTDTLYDSLSNVVPEEPYDTHGSIFSLVNRRSAIPDGKQYVLNHYFYLYEKMIANIATRTVDEETKAEFEDVQKSTPGAGNPAAALQNFDLAGWMAGRK